MKKRTLIVCLLLLSTTAVFAQKTASVTPDWSMSPTFGDISLDAGFDPDPYNRELIAGGSLNLRSFNSSYSGYVEQAPDINLYYEAGFLPLYIYISDADADTVLLVNTPSGEWLFNDDMLGSAAAIEIEDPDSGLYNIWVGTYSNSNVNATLSFSELGFGAGEINWLGDPTYGTVDLSSGFQPDPQRWDIYAGGSVNLTSMGYFGHVAENPDLDLYYEAGSFSLYIYIEDQDEDTILLIRDPNGEFHYNDDRSGSDYRPGISFRNPASGLYDIWVGTLGDNMASSTLVISEMPWSESSKDR